MQDQQECSSSAEDLNESVAELAERHLLVKDFEKAVEISKEALIDLDHEELNSTSAVRLAYVLGQAKFELKDLEDAGKLLRKIYGSFLNIPGEVVTLWFILMIDGASKETVIAFAEGFIKLYKSNIGELDKGKFALLYTTKVLCQICAKPDEAEDWIDSYVGDSIYKDLRKVLTLRVKAYREDRKEQQCNRDNGETSGANAEDVSTAKDTLSQSPKVLSIPEEWKGYLSPQWLIAAAVGGTIAYALMIELRGFLVKRSQKK